MDKYQIQYKYGTKTFVDTLEFKSFESIFTFFDGISACEVTEVREYVYENQVYKEDDNNYIHSASLSLYDDNFKHTFKIPKLKKTVTDTELKNFVSQHLKIGQNTIKSIKISKKYK